MIAETEPAETDYLAQAERLVKHPAELFRGVSDDLWLWMHTTGRNINPTLNALLPSLPTSELQKHWIGKADDAALTEGFEIYRTMRDLYATHFGDLRANGPVLDFGCGFGRILRYFVKDLDAGQVLGTDHDQTLVDVCKTNDRWSTVTRNEARPPLPFDDSSVGFIYAYSVFSHFDEPIHRAWLEEFKRILRPGGACALTVRRRSFIDYCRRVRETDDPRANWIAKQMFLDADEAEAGYDRGEYVFTTYRPNDPTAGWWGEACVGRPYIDLHWTDLFDVVDVAGPDLMQDVVLLRG